MSIIVTYSHHCDFCARKIGKEESYEIRPYHFSSIPKPNTPLNIVGNQFACDDCCTAANHAAQVTGLRIQGAKV